MNEALVAFSPNKVTTSAAMKILITGQVVAFFILWLFYPLGLMPSPGEVLKSLSDLWARGLGAELITSFKLNLEAIAWATLVSLALSYATVLPFFRPIVAMISKLRFLSMVGLTFVFTVMASSGHQLKLSILAFAITVFFVTSMADVLAAIPKEQFDLARTLRMGEWRVVWEVVILGQIDKVFDVVRQNAAIGWMMLTMVEGIVRSEGGIGTVLIDQNKHFRLSGIFAIQLMILSVGLAQDYAIAWLKTILCPYATLTTVKK